MLLSTSGSISLSLVSVVKYAKTPDPAARLFAHISGDESYLAGLYM